MSSLCRGHANHLCIFTILVYVLLKQAQLWPFYPQAQTAGAFFFIYVTGWESSPSALLGDLPRTLSSSPSSAGLDIVYNQIYYLVCCPQHSHSTLVLSELTKQQNRDI